jgi:hypothetical protein
LGAQAVSPNLCYFSALYLRDRKNRTVIGSSYGCAKKQQSQPIKPAMSGDLKLRPLLLRKPLLVQFAQIRNERHYDEH